MIHACPHGLDDQLGARMTGIVGIGQLLHLLGDLGLVVDQPQLDPSAAGFFRCSAFRGSRLVPLAAAPKSRC